MVYQTDQPPGILAYATEPTRNTTVSVPNSNTEVCEKRNNTNPRKVIVIRNTSTNANEVITINLGNDQAVANSGIVLKPNESFADSSETGYECFQGQITGICAVAGPGQLSIFER